MPTDLEQQALRSFRRDLPDLYRERPSEWVAYQGTSLIGFGPEKHLLYQDCVKQGHYLDEFVVFCIEPIETEMWLTPEAIP